MSSGEEMPARCFSAFGSYVEVAGKFAVPEPRMFIGGEEQHELSRRRVDFLFLEVGKRKAHSLVRSEEEGIHWGRRGRLVVGGRVRELLEGQDHSGADLSTEAYDAEARREYGEKVFHDISLSSPMKKKCKKAMNQTKV